MDGTDSESCLVADSILAVLNVHALLFQVPVALNSVELKLMHFFFIRSFDINGLSTNFMQVRCYPEGKKATDRIRDFNKIWHANLVLKLCYSLQKQRSYLCDCD